MESKLVDEKSRIYNEQIEIFTYFVTADQFRGDGS